MGVEQPAVIHAGKPLLREIGLSDDSDDNQRRPDGLRIDARVAIVTTAPVVASLLESPPARRFGGVAPWLSVRSFSISSSEVSPG